MGRLMEGGEEGCCLIKMVSEAMELKVQVCLEPMEDLPAEGLNFQSDQVNLEQDLRGLNQAGILQALEAVVASDLVLVEEGQVEPR